MHVSKPKYPVGTRVRVINEKHRNGETGYVDKVKKIAFFSELLKYTYHVQFKDGAVSSFYEGNIKEEPYICHLKAKKSTVYTVEMVKDVGAVSTGFIEAGDVSHDFLKEATMLGTIREVAYEDVTNKHFINWFFALDDWVGNNPDKFPFYEIVHNDGFHVYGYFNGDKLNGIIRVDDYGDRYNISFFSVNKSLQHQGIGQRLFQAILSRFNDKAIILGVYTDNACAIHIYKKYGFRIMGSGPRNSWRPTAQSYEMRREVGKGFR